MAEANFVKGMYFEKPKPPTPEFIKGKISIKVAELVPYLQENENGGGYVNIDLKKSKAGKYYFQLNDWKPSDSPSSPKTAVEEL